MAAQHDHRFDRDYWEAHWLGDHERTPGSTAAAPPNPYLAAETGHLRPGTALDAGCGAGAEATWLAAHGWEVVAADISSEALAQAAARAAAQGVSDRLRWVQADLTTWDPRDRFDLVTTHYAHPAMPQLEFYDRIARWVAPGGTLLVVGHLHHSAAAEDGHQPPAHATVTAAAVAARLDREVWQIVTADERRRTLTRDGSREVTLQDVVVRATRR